MTNPIIGLIGGLVSPLMQLIDNLHTSDEERGVLRLKLYELQSSMAMQILEYESKIIDNKRSVIEAEATGGGFLQRSWRPITMLIFVSLVVSDSYGLLPNRLAEEAWILIQIGLGGYVGGRSAEKIAPVVRDMFNKKG